MKYCLLKDTSMRPVLVAEQGGVFTPMTRTIIDSTQIPILSANDWVFTQEDIVTEYDIDIPNEDIDFERLREEKADHVLILVRDDFGMTFTSRIRAASYNNRNPFTDVNAFVVNRNDLKSHIENI